MRAYSVNEKVKLLKLECEHRISPFVDVIYRLMCLEGPTYELDTRTNTLTKVSNGLDGKSNQIIKTAKEFIEMIQRETDSAIRSVLNAR